MKFELKKLFLSFITILIVVGNVSLPIFAYESTPTVESPTKEKEERIIIDKDDKQETTTNKETIIQEKEDEKSDYIDLERNDGCFDRVVITSYEDRDNIIDPIAYEQICKAYNEINEANDLSVLNKDIEDIAYDHNTEVENLAVRYLFDISIFTNYDEKVHDEKTHNTYTDLHVEFENLEDFVCLMMYKDGVWSIVEGVRIDPENPNRLFIPILTGCASYALVVANGYNQVEPIIEENKGGIIHWIILLLGAILTVLFIILRNKEDDRNDSIKGIKTIKVLLLIIDYVLSLFLFIFYRDCELDIIALLINYTITLLSFLMNKKDQDEEKNY